MVSIDGQPLIKKIKITVLMYHEVSKEPTKFGTINKMTPKYNISVNQFEAQLSALYDRGYQSIFFDDVDKIDAQGKVIIITFDDGLIGNARYALPILKRYGYKAIFFIPTNFIGSSRYMDWSDLEQLMNEGMSIQSHTLSHRSLQLLTEREIRNELIESRNRLKNRLHREVNALSFPHGSYNKRIIQIAEESGYQ